ncbi:translation elongation factor Ts [Candidatus Pelagibacter sp.]|nr:translation elongation factor Ts [Candidatus Pelagibacter sp.]
MSQDLQNIKQLRKNTGAGFKDCNLALKEANGDLDKAIEILRVKGISKASKKMSRVANEGVIAVTGNSNKISLIEVNCETDFVAKNEDFIKFVKELSEINNDSDSNLEKIKQSMMKNGTTVEENLVNMVSKIGEKITIGRQKTFNKPDSKNFYYLHTVVKDNLSKLAVILSIETVNNSEKLTNFAKQLTMHIAASNPLAIEDKFLDKSDIEKEELLIKEELKNSGKSADIVDKISVGKMTKFKQDNSLLTQAWVMEPKKKVKDIIAELNISDLKIKEFYRLKIGE